MPQPAIAFAASYEDGDSHELQPCQLSPAIVIELSETGGKILLPNAAAPKQFTRQELQQKFQPHLLLIQTAEPVLEESQTADSQMDKPKKFGFSWFIPELLKHKKIWRDVLLASLAIQVVGLSTPLFTQVIIDKVIAHHSESTLLVLGAALIVFMLFTSAMTWLRQYLILHTGNRIDAVLGDQCHQVKRCSSITRSAG